MWEVTSCRAQWDRVTLLVGRAAQGKQTWGHQESLSGLPDLQSSPENTPPHPPHPPTPPPPPRRHATKAPVHSLLSKREEERYFICRVWESRTFVWGASSSPLDGTNMMEKDGKLLELASNHAALWRKEQRGPESTSAGSLDVR